MLGEGPIEAPLHYGYGLLRCGLGGLPPRASTSRPPSYLLHLGRASAWRPAPHPLRRLAAHLLLGCPKSQCLAHCCLPLLPPRSCSVVVRVMHSGRAVGPAGSLMLKPHLQTLLK